MATVISMSKDPICASTTLPRIGNGGCANIWGGAGSIQPYLRLWSYFSPLNLFFMGQQFYSGSCGCSSINWQPLNMDYGSMTCNTGRRTLLATYNMDVFDLSNLNNLVANNSTTSSTCGCDGNENDNDNNKKCSYYC